MWGVLVKQAEQPRGRLWRTQNRCHDLTVLDQMLVKHRGLVEEPVFTAWREKVEQERESRLQQYREKTSAKSSLLRIWREGLPAEKDLRSIGLARLGEWASFVTPDFPRVQSAAVRR